VLTSDLLEGPELDRIDDELFATDYRSPSQRRHLTVLPEPPTVRVLQHSTTTAPRYMVVTAEWPEVPYPASPYTSDENGAEIIALIGLAVLVVVVVAAAAIILVWWA
jgi:hypothetical protein